MDLFTNEKFLFNNKSFENKDASIAQKNFQQSIIINISDKVSAEKLCLQIEELLKRLRK